jgi:pyruvate dehydrogenase E2 component (dihydrolipoamide acetyltransferase)
LGAEVGQTIHVGDTLVWIDETGQAPAEPVIADKEKPVVQEKSAGVVGSIEVSDEVIQASDEMVTVSSASQRGDKVLATPVARKMAADLGVELKMIAGSGENGRIMKEDIMKAAASQDKRAVAPSLQVTMPTFNENDVTRVKISKLRKTIVNAMSVANAVIPMTTLMDEYDVHRLVETRERHKDAAKAQGVKLTYLAFIAKAVTLALREYPLLNSSFDHDHDEIIFKKHINLGIAVDTSDGLIVPNIKNADTKSIIELAQDIDRVATEARERTIKLETLQNGTFTLTNYGAFGTKYGTPVIKHPEVAILGIGGIYQKPIVDESGQIVVRDVLPLSLTIDHRIVDGADGGRFLVKLKEYLSDPASLLLRLK